MSRTALIMIHGIGQQQRNATRDQLISGLELQGAKDVGTGVAIDLEEDTAPAISRRLSLQEDKSVDVFEMYWSPLTSGHTNFTSFTTQLIRDTIGLPGKLYLFPGKGAKPWYDAFYAVCVVALIGCLIYATIVALQWAASKNNISTTSGAELAGLLTTFPSELVLLCMLAIYLFAQLVFQIWGLFHGSRCVGSQILVSILSILGILGIGVYLDSRASLALLLLVLFYSIFRGLTRFLKKNVVDYLGDIQVYTTYFETDAKQQARESILRRGCELIQSIHDHQIAGVGTYDRVVIVAHSLGAPIAADVLWRMANHAVLKGRAYPKIRSLITCGAALEKVFMLAALKGRPPVQLAPMPGNNGGSEWWFAGLSNGTPGSPSHIRWHNAWYFADIVANAADPTHFADYDPKRDIFAGESLQRFRHATLRWVHGDYFVDLEVTKAILSECKDDL